MKTNTYKYFLLIAGMLSMGAGMTQSANNNVVPFKEIHRKQNTDNFIARELQKKELDITPAQKPLPTVTCNQPGKEAKSRKKKKASL